MAALSDPDKRDLLKLMARIVEKARTEWLARQIRAVRISPGLSMHPGGGRPA